MIAVISAIFAAIELLGLSGGELRVRSYFDANNVQVGDPLLLTVDFIGEAQFSNLHPPALSRLVDRRDWKIDDLSAKTDTFRDAKRITYRVRPMRKGLLTFPALEFEYTGEDGKTRTISSNKVPVHSKGGAKAQLAVMDEFQPGFPAPPALSKELPGECRSPDEIFAWKKACSKPSAEAFEPFDFPAARMNAASCEILAGNWANALKIYRRLEWRVGQTPEIEQGIIAALARKYDNRNVELPVWRSVFRPILRYSWTGRVGIVLAGMVLLLIVQFLLKRCIKAVACLAIAAMPAALPAQGLFQHFFGGSMPEHDEVRISADVKCSKENLHIGERFEFILSLEAPATSSIGQIRIIPSNNFGLKFVDQAENLTDEKASQSANVVKRFSIPARYDVPFRGALSFTVEGMVSGRTSRGGQGNFFSFSFSNSFSAKTREVKINVSPLPGDGQPDDYAGVISHGLELKEFCDILEVETNDVITITYRLKADGYVPKNYNPQGVDFEWGRSTGNSGEQYVEYRRFFVADGRQTTPTFSIPYYDGESKKYVRAQTGGTKITYKANAD